MTGYWTWNKTTADTLQWSAINPAWDDVSAGCSPMPKRGERFVHFRGRSDRDAFGVINWRKAKRLERIGVATEVRLVPAFKS